MHLSQVVLLALFATANAATVSHDAKCGASGGGRTCLGSQWGSCCSQHGWCGSADTYCGTGCQSKFGTCDGGSNPSPNPSPRPSPIVSKPVSKNARCGTGFGGTTCLGSKWGDCCSQYSYCGSSSDYCAPKKGCQDQFGRCDGTPIVSPSRSSSLVVSSKASTSSAQPSPTKACDPIDAVINILNGPLQGQASSFCLSYLGGDKTVEQTSTLIVSGPARTAIVTAPDETNIATADVTSVNLITRTSYVQLPDVTSTQYVTIFAATKTIYAKRRGSDLQARADLPAQLQPFAATRISSACSCIATPGVRTVLATQIQSTEGAEVTSLVPGATVTSTVYQTIQVTSEATVVETLPPTAVAVQTAAKTIQPILVKPKICNVRGLPGPNAFNYGANFNSDQANCIATCKIDARCFSTGFYQVTNPSSGTITGTCRYYDKSVTDSANLGVGYYNFNDKAC